MKLTLIKPTIGRPEHSLYVDEGRMEPLNLGVLAALTPPDVEVVMYDDRCEPIPYAEPTDLVGITGFDERWLYTQKFSDLRQESKPQEMPAGLDNVIVVAQSMDYDLIRTVPSALSSAA